MSSPSEERRPEELPRSHPTPPSTPSPLTDESDTESGLSTTRANSPPNANMSSEPSVLVIGTLGQRQAAAINNILSKISVKKPLDSNTWNSWSDAIGLGLAGAMYDGYIESDDLPEGEDEKSE
ncbi:hypothetical protein CROQUDRAFT_86747 [Cronartium quercuum f. sp. fusiforme G11]|uniref:Uncharacterized protein n=1 Tax=Cronartium quercuum f. sp. fusiforme G11 TaxID=708437 RepID=A0A9P6NXM7_9BASI|nr:hypothetical protein CROQUDRAFT_86747 [Cronartium quercuum f. sp. fusiforme G11]